MARLALTGRSKAGKTTLARALRDRLGYAYVNYTDYLKALAVMALAGVGIATTPDLIHAQKETYRPFLIALGDLVGFTDGAYVETALDAVRDGGVLPNHVVFDNVRFPTQWEMLRAHGFTLVRLVIHDDERQMRGATAPDLDEMPVQDGEIAVRATMPTPRQIEYLHDAIGGVQW